MKSRIRLKTMITNYPRQVALRVQTLLFPERYSLLAAFDRLLLPEMLKAVASNNTDRRELAADVARHLGLEESKVISRLAQEMKMPFLKQVQPIHSNLVRDREQLELFHRHAVIPVAIQDAIIGYACVDPSLAKVVTGDLKRRDLFIASWDQISNAIQESVLLFDSSYEDNKQAVKRERQRQVENILNLIVQEARRYGAERVQLRFTRLEVIYEFRLPDKRKGTGSVAKRWRELLLEVLNSAASGADDNFYMVDLKGLKVEILSPDEFFMLNWSNQQTLLSYDEQDKLSESKDLSFVNQGSAEAIEVVNQEDLLLKFKDSESESVVTVLIVEDNQTFADVLRRFLEKRGIKVLLATNGLEALNILQNRASKPDVLVSDVHMPHMNAFELVQRVRGTDEFKELPVLVLTSDADFEVELKFVSFGVEAFISKGADPRLLVEHIKRVVKKNLGNSKFVKENQKVAA